MDLIDIGINLTHDSFADDRAAVLASAQTAGVSQLIVTGATLEGSAAALELARAHPQLLFATAGVHPHHAVTLTAAELPQLRALLLQPGVVAAGECGLDYFRNYAPHAAQRHAFTLQLQLALECAKPLFLHQRDAHHDFVAALRDMAQPLRGVAHCLTGGLQELESYLELGLHIGITGWICDERRGQHLRDLVRLVPLDRLMLETDAPYLLPRDLRPKPSHRRNEPKYLPHILAAVAACRGEPAAAVAAAATDNAIRFFGFGRDAA
jgi:TatD DNase family protein